MSIKSEQRRTEPLRVVAGVVKPGGTGGSDAGRASAGPGTRRVPLDAAGVFIELEIVARKARTRDELRFALANIWSRLTAVDQAVLCEPGLGDEWRVTLASGVAAVDRNAPFVHALDAWLRSPRRRERQTAQAHVCDLAADQAHWELDGEAVGPRHAFWVPLRARDGGVFAGLLLMRFVPWQAHETALLLPLADAYAHAWTALAANRSPVVDVQRHVSKRALSLAVGAAMLVAAFIPVPMSTLAPAEIVAAEPAVVTAPLDGVIAEIAVPPGTFVQKDQLIAKFVDVKARADVEIASRNVAVASAKHFRNVQAATANAKDAQDLALTKSEWELAKAELAYAVDVLARSEVRAERAGLLIYAAKSDWVGKPVSTGERMMEIGDPAKVEVRIDLPISDAIVLEPGNRLTLFLDGDPLSGIAGRVTRTSYRPVLAADQQLIYRIFGSFDADTLQRIGLRGTARLSSHSVALAYYLFRRPIAAARQKLGL